MSQPLKSVHVPIRAAFLALDLQVKEKYIGNMDNVAESLTAINKTLEKLNGIMKQVADTMPKPASKFTSVLETIVLIFSIFGIVGIADIIIKWFTGGFVSAVGGAVRYNSPLTRWI